MPYSAARSAERKGSNPSTCMANPWARLATARPTRPRPMIPSALPPSWVPVNLVRSQRPALRLSLALTTFRERASIRAIVCSAVEIVLPPGVFMTTIPWRVAVGTSMLSTPTPARAITLRRGWPFRTSAVSCVPDRITMPSASASAARRAPGSSLVETTTSRPLSARSSSRPSSASLSVTNTRCATIEGPPCCFAPKMRRRMREAHQYLVREGIGAPHAPYATRRLRPAGDLLPPQQHLLRGGHGATGLDVEAEVIQDHLQRREAGHDVDLVHVTQVADTDDPTLELPLAAD